MPRSPHKQLGSCGFTILELATVLVLLCLSFGSLLPGARRQLDRVAVLEAREELAGLFHRARFEAVAFGGATLHLKSDSASGTLIAGGEVLDRTVLLDEYGVSLTISAGRPEVELTFDSLGLGRVASQTLRLRKRDAEVVLVVSSFGRIVRK